MIATLPNATILIVDDHSVNTQFLSELLRTAGYDLLHLCNDAREAPELFRIHTPDLVLLDLEMPHLDGYQLMELFRRETPDSDYLPVIVLTAHAEQEHKIRALKAGAQDFIHKPIDSLEVLLRIRNFLNIRLLQNSLREHNQLLEDRVRDRTRQLMEAQQEIIYRLGKAADYRDTDTGNHIYRMSRYTGVLARAAGYPEEVALDLETASTLHDIGKIGIPDSILLKPGPLSPPERALMESHTLIGSSLLADSGQRMIQLAETIARAHHERWDGTGYPKGLKGKEIPKEARICAICDVFDALTSERPYKKAWTTEEALTRMQESSGSHFDPELLELFISVLSDIEEIRLSYKDDRSVSR
ncbi:HD-GYP domain-containing protein [Gorillibacterium sp. sgz5001074]|uniref:HD-GYP domain-containing protein n=1 Tax=Gorillibacterium sp. sgz5001074 TaxID=3446695 RepID=UPI003F679046